MTAYKFLLVSVLSLAVIGVSQSALALNVFAATGPAATSAPSS
ncbi:MAG: hypothetical protein ACYDC5_13435 [Candidatus Dormibacteria bacterium]